MFPVSPLWYIIGNKISEVQRGVTEFNCDFYITGQKEKSQKLQTDESKMSLYILNQMAYLPSKSCLVRKMLFCRCHFIEIKSRPKKKEKEYYIYFLYYILCVICSGKIEGLTEII